MKVNNAVHVSHGWLISELVPDFTLLDVWALPVTGARDDADAALRLLVDFDPVTKGPVIVRGLFAARLAIGRLLRWDAEVMRPIPGAAEISNATVHGLLHLAWAPDDGAEGDYRAQMAVYVKSRGWLGRSYLALIEPFRQLVVYPAMMRELERSWANR